MYRNVYGYGDTEKGGLMMIDRGREEEEAGGKERGEEKKRA